MSDLPPSVRGRGAASNPPNRFEPLHYEPDPDSSPEDQPSPRTQFLTDHSDSIITYNDSPDIPFRASINPYRGCEHGCIYCYARPFHEYLGFSSGLDFETKILVKENAPELLRREMESPKWKPQTVALSGVTDPYQPIERRLQITRRCLEVFAEFRNPVSIVTKNALVTRDVDVLTRLAQHNATRVSVSITTLDNELARIMEPRTSQPYARLAAVEALAKAGIPVGVFIAPCIPGLTDHEIPSIVAAAAKAGAKYALCLPLRLPHAVRELFDQWLEQHFPLRKEKVLAGIRAIRGGKLNDARFGSRFRGEGEAAEQMMSLFAMACRKAGLTEDGPELSTEAFRRSAGVQMTLL